MKIPKRNINFIDKKTVAMSIAATVIGIICIRHLVVHANTIKIVEQPVPLSRQYIDDEVWKEDKPPIFDRYVEKLINDSTELDKQIPVSNPTEKVVVFESENKKQVLPDRQIATKPTRTVWNIENPYKNMSIVEQLTLAKKGEYKLIPTDELIYYNGVRDIVDWNNLLVPSTLTLDEMKHLLQGKNIQRFAYHYLAAEQIYGVNAVALASLTCLESGDASSPIFRQKNNMSGFSAYDSSPGQSATRFETPEDSIYVTAAHLKKEYLTAGGSWYNGVSLSGVNVKYSTDKKWSEKIVNIVKNWRQNNEIK